MAWLLAGGAGLLAIIMVVIFLVVWLMKRKRQVQSDSSISFATDLEREKVRLGLRAKAISDQQRRYEDAQAAAGGAISAIDTNDADRLASQLSRAGVTLQRPTNANIRAS